MHGVHADRSKPLAQTWAGKNRCGTDTQTPRLGPRAQAGWHAFSSCQAVRRKPPRTRGGGYLRYRPGEEGTPPLPISLTNGQGIPHAGGSLCVAAPNFGWFSKQTSSDHHPILAMRCARAQLCNLGDRAHVVAVTVRAAPLYACRGPPSCPVSLSLRGATGVGRNGRCMKYVPQVCSVDAWLGRTCLMRTAMCLLYLVLHAPADRSRVCYTRVLSGRSLLLLRWKQRSSRATRSSARTSGWMAALFV